MAQQVQWGMTTLMLDNEAFRRGFLATRRWYFEDLYGEDGRQSEEVLRLVVMPDEQGRYHFDEMGYENLPEYLGDLGGYLGGPLAPLEAEDYRNQQAQQAYLRSSVTA